MLEQARAMARCCFPAELEALLHYNGLRVRERYGDFKNAPFGSSSLKQVILCEASG